MSIAEDWKAYCALQEKFKDLRVLSGTAVKIRDDHDGYFRKDTHRKGILRLRGYNYENELVWNIEFNDPDCRGWFPVKLHELEWL